MRSGSSDVDQTVALLREAARAMRSVTACATDEIRAIHAAVNALQAREADLLAVMGETKAYEGEGASSMATWAARELRQDPKVTRQMVRAATAMRDLPKVGNAARAGQVSLAQVDAFSYSIKHVGRDETINVETQLLDLTAELTPAELFAQMRICKAIAHPDELDQAWLAGMDKQDIQCLPVGDGFHVTGFLPIDVGAKLKTYLDSVSVPRDGHDDRTNAERRVDGLDDLLTNTLASGLPSDNGIRAHLNVTVDAERLKAALNGQAGTASQPELLTSQPAILEGFGPIGPALLAYLAAGATLTPILVSGFEPNRTVLDVGRSRRLATKEQTTAIRWRQHGRCANPGCHHPIGQIHHLSAWSDGGATNIDNLAGLCRKCHSLITIGTLTMTGTHQTGYTFTTTRTKPRQAKATARTG